MVNVGVIGVGMMGSTHLDVYSQLDNVRIVAVADSNPDRLSGKSTAKGNIEGQAQGRFDMSQVTQYQDAQKLIDDDQVELVDVCVPTPAHLPVGLAALVAGKHVLIEKPLARTAADARKLADAADQAQGLSMPAMCMRFWPGWTWLKEAIAAKTYGKVHSAAFRRLASHPGGPFYSNGDMSGGAILDLHVHDTDFIHYCFGMPDAVFTRGYHTVTNQPDHVSTHYLYEDGDAPALVTAEGGWAMMPGFGFQMEYTVNFEKATAIFDADGLRLIEAGKEPRMIDLEPGMGYEREIAYFVNHIEKGQAPTRVTLREAAQSVRIVEAEARSATSGKIERV